MKESQRQRKFGRLIQKEMGAIFLEDKKNILEKRMVSVVDVKVSPDLSIARIYLGMMLIDDKNEMLQKIEMHKNEFKNVLGNRIGKQVRRIPEIIFYIDELEEQAMRIEKLLNDLDLPPEEKE